MGAFPSFRDQHIIHPPHTIDTVEFCAPPWFQRPPFPRPPGASWRANEANALIIGETGTYELVARHIRTSPGQRNA